MIKVGDQVRITAGDLYGKVGKLESFGTSWNGATAQVYIGGLFAKTVLVRDIEAAQASR